MLVHTAAPRPSQALAEGALGVVLKREAPAVLVDAVREAAQGRAVMTPSTAQALEASPHLEAQVSPQERRALRLYAADHPATSVARRTGVTEGTVEECLERIRAKLADHDVRASTKLELREVAEQMGPLDEPASAAS